MPHLKRLRRLGRLLHHLSHQNDRLVIRAKRDGSPVSAVDLESHTAIQNVLALHGIIISEEGDLPPYAERSNWPLFWLVDPLDGTQCTDHREGFAINIALCDASGPILGVVADPLSDRIFAAPNPERFDGLFDNTAHHTTTCHPAIPPRYKL